MSHKILIVDDDESIVDAIVLILEDAGFAVESTSNSEEINEKVDLFHPDIIILDVLMSGSDGRTICKKLKKDTRTRDIPILMISAHPSAKESALECGADDFLPKPFEVSELLNHITNLLRK